MSWHPCILESMSYLSPLWEDLKPQNPAMQLSKLMLSNEGRPAPAGRLLYRKDSASRGSYNPSPRESVPAVQTKARMHAF